MLLSVLVAMTLSGCCGGGASDDCRATLTYRGGTGPGAGTDKAAAQKGACWKYCIDRDPDVDAAYKRWVAAGNQPKPGGKTWTLDDVPSLKMVRLACEDQCQRDIAAGKGQITFTNCK